MVPDPLEGHVVNASAVAAGNHDINVNGGARDDDEDSDYSDDIVSLGEGTGAKIGGGRQERVDESTKRSPGGKGINYSSSSLPSPSSLSSRSSHHQHHM